MLLLLLAATAVVVIGGGVALERLTRQPPGVARILAAPATAIGEVPDATDVRIEGVVEVFERTLAAPVSGVRCVYFAHEVRLADDGGLEPSTSGGRIVHHSVDAAPFVVRDRTGHAIVDPTGATVLLELHRQAVDRAAAGHTLGLFGGGRDQLTSEYVIEPGDRLVVIGRAVREPDPDARAATAAYRDGPATRVRFTHTPRFALHLLAPSRLPTG